ncbi:heavy metal-associated isoprenylated plant protein 22-like [Lycium barbarum]|uniref:heavy metal-associated isoprenylated plant protein 22-like n=1 Tax=Lycium barbarum TaxID=112863 RepID=UPI00293E8056|nr:heavy metal-associated isoprenylated plant protein 22-like [Lycium barbarum]
MEPFAEVSCILKVDVHCDACKMKMVEVLSAVCGVYALTINAEKGEVNVCGEVDPNLLVKALKGTGKHAEIVSVKLKHPALCTPTPHYNYYRPPYIAYGYNHSALGGPYGFYPTMTMSPYYSMRRPMMEHPHYYGHPSSYPRFRPFYY